MDLINSTKSYIKEHDLIRPGDIVLAAVSGGMDSIALAYILISLRQELKFNLPIANFNHQLRQEAEEEARFVADFAKANQITYFLGGADIASLAIKGNLQEIAIRSSITDHKDGISLVIIGIPVNNTKGRTICQLTKFDRKTMAALILVIKRPGMCRTNLHFVQLHIVVKRGGSSPSLTKVF